MLPGEGDAPTASRRREDVLPGTVRSHPARLLPPYRSLGCRAGARARFGDLRAEPPERVDRSRVPAVPRPATRVPARQSPAVPDAGDRFFLSRVRGDPGPPASGRGLRPCTEPRDVRYGARGARPGGAIAIFPEGTSH